MNADPITIIIDPESELGRALEISQRPVLLVSGNERFTVSREPRDASPDHDVEAFRQALHEISGMITPEEAERRKELIYRSREEGSRPLGKS
jgi:hypothetical protein